MINYENAFRKTSRKSAGKGERRGCRGFEIKAYLKNPVILD